MPKILILRVEMGCKLLLKAYISTSTASSSVILEVYVNKMFKKWGL